jgi:hypothetical protein
MTTVNIQELTNTQVGDNNTEIIDGEIIDGEIINVENIDAENIEKFSWLNFKHKKYHFANFLILLLALCNFSFFGIYYNAELSCNLSAFVRIFILCYGVIYFFGFFVLHKFIIMKNKNSTCPCEFTRSAGKFLFVAFNIITLICVPKTLWMGKYDYCYGTRHPMVMLLFSEFILGIIFLVIFSVCAIFK